MPQGFVVAALSLGAALAGARATTDGDEEATAAWQRWRFSITIVKTTTVMYYYHVLSVYNVNIYIYGHVIGSTMIDID